MILYLHIITDLLAYLQISDSKADVSTSEDQKGKPSLGNSPSVPKHEFEIAESNLNDLCEYPHAGTAPSAPPLPLPNDSAFPTGQSNVRNGMKATVLKSAMCLQLCICVYTCTEWRCYAANFFSDGFIVERNLMNQGC